MCGFVGIWTTPNSNELSAATLADRAGVMSYRGPDDEGTWSDAACGIGFGFRRLAIMDLSSTGHQPMVSPSNRYVIVFNGEIYNHRSMRRELEATGHCFRGTSDTEVALAAFERWGIGEAVSRFNGMFAIAVWDRVDKRLHLMRDHMGIKPLFYACTPNGILFGSEIKALRQYAWLDTSIDSFAASIYFDLNFIPAPFTIYSAIRQAPKAAVHTFKSQWHEGVSTPYWSHSGVMRAGTLHPFKGSARDAEEALNQRVNDAVALRMIADVPVGVFLSGGVDSSLIASVMQVHHGTALRTYTVDVDQIGWSEAESAKAVAKHLGTAHTSVRLGPAEVLNLIPELAVLSDQPFGDASVIPTYVVSKLARREVTVGLSGDGGDELFGGYASYRLIHYLSLFRRLVPRILRDHAAGILARVAAQAGERRLDRLSTLGALSGRGGPMKDKLLKLATLLRARKRDEVFVHLYSSGIGSQRNRGREYIADIMRELDGVTDQEALMYFDQASYLPDDILVKLDRTSMRASLEARVPLLDHRLVEFAWTLPFSLKVREGQGKWILRKLLTRYVPQQLTLRPKMGFELPIGQWLRGPLLAWAEDMLSEARIRRSEFLDPAAVSRMWQEHKAGLRNWRTPLWTALMFETWKESERAASAPATLESRC